MATPPYAMTRIPVNDYVTPVAPARADAAANRACRSRSRYERGAILITSNQSLTVS